ncbi:Uncharacterised protein [Actinomyces bovis]|uniref:Uncharacterized protein n=1 Tax=Actinomyces bovis TaxID=1658 RepID=A0ABY1VLI6_9ACTO|nr:hypothetical protein [Actinomyces bovis]SPT52950.1 Uncharacterised protein [Actinomyces bovis]VEG55139.1 Uncharacterised protein [Actinomyces israelii]
MREIEYVLPDNWVALDLSGSLGLQVDQVTRRMFAGAPTEAERARRTVAAQIRSSLEHAKSNGALQFLMEVDPVAGVRTGTSLTLMPFPENCDDPMETLVAVASTTPGAVVLESGDLVALRTMVTEDATQDLLDSVNESSRQVSELADQNLDNLSAQRRTLTYYVGHPDQKQDWMVFVGQIMSNSSPEAQEIADALVRMCDAIVSSVRFA